MEQPKWDEVRQALTSAIAAALPLQLRVVAGEPIAGVGLHIDGLYGAAGLYLLPESAVSTVDPSARNNIGDWPISTDWESTSDHQRAFAEHWGPHEEWFYSHMDFGDDDDGVEYRTRCLLRSACEAVRGLEKSGLFETFPKTEKFQLIVAEHDEPEEMSVERYELFLRTGEIRILDNMADESE